MGFILESIRVVGPFVFIYYILYMGLTGTHRATRDGLCWLISDKCFAAPNPLISSVEIEE